MMRSIFIGTLLGTLGIGGAAIAQDAFQPRPVRGVGAELPDAAPAGRQVAGVPGAANKRGPPGERGAKSSWPGKVPARVKAMHQEIVEELDLTPQQAKALQSLMIEKARAFKQRQATKGKGKPAQQGRSGKRPTPGADGERPARGDGSAKKARMAQKNSGF